MPRDPLNHDYPNWVYDSFQDASNVTNIHIFGPYRSDCQDILEDIANFLQDNGYSGARLCSDIPDHSKPPDMSTGEFNWWESVHCMKNAQAAIFIFLEPQESRLNGAPKEGLNSSAFAELTYWANFFADRKIGTHIILEGEMNNKGSLISGLVDLSNATEMTVESGDISAIKEDAVTTCIEWLQDGS